MNCYVSGIIGIAMLAGTFSCMTVSEDQHNRLRKIFSDELDEIYGKIVAERRNIYFQGLILGLLVAYFCALKIRFENTFHRITFFLAISLSITVLYYLLMPKSDYMLNHLKTVEENKAWLEVYKVMQQRYFLGVLFGLLSAIPIAYAMCG